MLINGWGKKGHKNLVAWEKKFEEILKQGPHLALRGALRCEISMSPAQDVFEEDEGEDIDKTNLRGDGGGSIITDHNGDGAPTDKKGRITAEY
jgi:hypothetical protein